MKRTPRRLLIICIVSILSLEAIFPFFHHMLKTYQPDTRFDEFMRGIFVEKMTTMMNPYNVPLRKDFAPTRRSQTKPDDIWQALLKEGSELLRSKALDPHSVICLEVGMYRLNQCQLAAEEGFQAHCIEASPNNFGRVVGTFKRAHRMKPRVGKRIHLYNAVAARQTNQTVTFSNLGSTGDTVVTERVMSNLSSTELSQVLTVRLDDIAQPFDAVFLAKIDTQGFEAEVMAGFRESLQQQKIHFLLMEYWPRGMDRLSSSPEACKVPIGLLQTIAQAGYTLYQLAVESHGSEPMAQLPVVRRRALLRERPYSNIVDNCHFFYELEKRCPGTYSMGYWTDILAVSPKSVLPKVPVTSIGQILRQNAEASRLESRAWIHKGSGP